MRDAIGGHGPNESRHRNAYDDCLDGDPTIAHGLFDAGLA